MPKLTPKEKFESLSSDAQKRMLASLKSFNKQLAQSSDRLEWRKWRIWYVDTTKPGSKDWLYVFAQTEHQAREFAAQLRGDDIAITQSEEVP